MTSLEAKPDYQRMDIQKRIQELLVDIREWERMTAEDVPADTVGQLRERERIARIAEALRIARDCR